MFNYQEQKASESQHENERSGHIGVLQNRLLSRPKGIQNGKGLYKWGQRFQLTLTNTTRHNPPIRMFHIMQVTAKRFWNILIICVSNLPNYETSQYSPSLLSLC